MWTPACIKIQTRLPCTHFAIFNGCLDIVLVLRKRNNVTPLLRWDICHYKWQIFWHVWLSTTHNRKNWLHSMTLLRSEIPSGVCAKLRTVAVSNNRDHARNLSLRTLVIMFNRSHVNIGRAATSQSLLLLLARATYVYGAVLHAHPVRGESYNQRNTTGEVATTPLSEIKSYVAS